jgi:hypothetical protein
MAEVGRGSECRGDLLIGGKGVGFQRRSALGAARQELALGRLGEVADPLAIVVSDSFAVRGLMVGSNPASGARMGPSFGRQ